MQVCYYMTGQKGKLYITRSSLYKYGGHAFEILRIFKVGSRVF